VQVCGIISVSVGFITFVDGQSHLYTDIVRHLPSTWPLFIVDRLPQTLIVVGMVMTLFGFLGFYGACTGSVSSLWMASQTFEYLKLLLPESPLFLSA
jgi:hypothetical protein